MQDANYLDYVHAELELALQKVFTGDITPLVYDLIKDTQYKRELSAFLKGKVNSNVYIDTTDSTSREKDNNRCSFEEWLSNCPEL